MHRIIQAQANPDFSVDLRFEDGQQARVDLSEVVQSAAIAAPFRDPARFVRNLTKAGTCCAGAINSNCTPAACAIAPFPTS